MATPATCSTTVQSFEPFVPYDVEAHAFMFIDEFAIAAQSHLCCVVCYADLEEQLRSLREWIGKVTEHPTRDQTVQENIARMKRIFNIKLIAYNKGIRPKCPKDRSTHTSLFQ